MEEEYSDILLHDDIKYCAADIPGSNVYAPGSLYISGAAGPGYTDYLGGQLLHKSQLLLRKSSHFPSQPPSPGTQLVVPSPGPSAGSFYKNHRIRNTCAIPRPQIRG